MFFTHMATYSDTSFSRQHDMPLVILQLPFKISLHKLTQTALIPYTFTAVIDISRVLVKNEAEYPHLEKLFLFKHENFFIFEKILVQTE